MKATYSPEDNKLRLYAGGRLDPETYAQVKAKGFTWAPKQELFVAPMWTPGREDLLIELCGEIEDEDTSLVNRAEERAERFGEYSEHRLEDAERAKTAVSEIADNIPLGQPILVGHHSEKRARKDAERIENGMRKAVKMWETSKYWEYRAAGAIRAAKYKERPDVRARRIKGLEADLRKQEREKKNAEQLLKMWSNDCAGIKRKDGGKISFLDRAKFVCNYYDQIYIEFPLDRYPRPEGASTYTGKMSLWSALGGSDEIGFIAPEQARDIAIPIHKRTVGKCDRWIDHISNRLIYEKAMLNEQGKSDLIAPKPRPKQLPICNYRAPEGIRVENNYRRGEFFTYPQIEMTKAEYAKIRIEDKGCYIIENSHRVRCYIKVRAGNYERFVVFITDAPTHEKPEPIERVEKERPIYTGGTYTPPERTKFDDLKDALKEGVKVVSAPQLFPTPQGIADKMVELADLQDGLCVLEPSAGTGNLVKAVLNTVDTEVLAYEINRDLCSSLSRAFPSYKLQVRQADFLEVTDFQGQYPRIIMNPPFENGADIKHIKHAMTFLAPGGKLVALCANGPRQREMLEPMADYWEPLPDGSFKAQGTGVNVALMVING